MQKVSKKISEAINKENPTKEADNSRLEGSKIKK